MVSTEIYETKNELLHLFNEDPTSDFVTRLNKPEWCAFVKKQHQNLEH